VNREFYARDAEIVAKGLLNCLLVRTSEEGTVVGRICETEAYTQDDCASHSFRGCTPANLTMFGEPGLVYVYFTYGMHYCANVVTGIPGSGEAVLIRAVEPLEGLELMLLRRGLSHGTRLAIGRTLCGGPGRLCQAFGIDRNLDGTDLVSGGPLTIYQLTSIVCDSDIAKSRRIGVSKGVDFLRRFVVAGDRYTSRVEK